MKRPRLERALGLWPAAALFALLVSAAGAAEHWPGPEWAKSLPADAGLDAERLRQAADDLGGRGMIVRGGRQVWAWGDPATAGDIASAAKPFYSHFCCWRSSKANWKALTLRSCGTSRD